MNIKSTLFLVLFSVFSTLSYAQDINPLEGKWDMVISQSGKDLPSWLEINHSGNHTLVGRFVYAFGSARPISEIKVKDGEFSFDIPPQWEPEGGNMIFSGRMTDNDLAGTMIYTDGETYNWTATRAPALLYNENPTWGAPIAIFNGKDLNGWHAMGENQWLVEDGILRSPKSGSNLVTDATFKDFKLHMEFRYPEGSNSGMYLRGRYEVQITDPVSTEPSAVEFSGVYGFLTPNQLVAKGPDKWQSYDITLIGRRVTIIVNGVTVIKDQNIPGITGGALDSNEGAPGPFLIQGDHGPIEFRNIVVTPVLE